LPSKKRQNNGAIIIFSVDVFVADYLTTSLAMRFNLHALNSSRPLEGAGNGREKMAAGSQKPEGSLIFIFGTG
jgi:hypothetical protein